MLCWLSWRGRACLMLLAGSSGREGGKRTGASSWSGVRREILLLLLVEQHFDLFDRNCSESCTWHGKRSSRFYAFYKLTFRSWVWNIFSSDGRTWCCESSVRRRRHFAILWFEVIVDCLLRWSPTSPLSPCRLLRQRGVVMTTWRHVVMTAWLIYLPLSVGPCDRAALMRLVSQRRQMLQWCGHRSSCCCCCCCCSSVNARCEWCRRSIVVLLVFRWLLALTLYISVVNSAQLPTGVRHQSTSLRRRPYN